MTVLKDVQTGAIAGLTATVPMTLAMIEFHDHLPFFQKRPLPPRQIIRNLTKKIGVHHKLDQRERFITTMVAHFSVGTTAGAIYGPVSKHLPFHPAVSGAIFGLGVWAGNYLGVLPALDLLKPATKHTAQRNGLMIAAHLIWGAATGVLVAGLRRDQEHRRHARQTLPSAASQWQDRARHQSPLPHSPSDNARQSEAAMFCESGVCELDPAADSQGKLPDEMKPPV